MGHMNSRPMSTAQLAAHQDATGLSIEQIQKLYKRFNALDRTQRGYLTPTELLRIPQLAQNPLQRQIVNGFFADSGDRLYFEQFLRVCSAFMVPQFPDLQRKHVNARAQKWRLLCKMIDTQSRGYIARDDFERAMQNHLANLPSPAAGDAALGKNPNADMKLLTEQAFGRQQQLSYQRFEQRLRATDIEGKLAVSKWLQYEMAVARIGHGDA